MAFENTSVVKAGDPLLADPDKPRSPDPKNPLDDDIAKRRLAKLSEWMENERMRQAPSRYQQALDEDFYDGLQWSPEDEQILQDRGQAPLVYNKVKPAVKWITGTEKRTKMDFRVFPRSNDDRSESENKTKVLKYVQDVNRSQYSRSRAFEDAVKVGIGWLECGLRGDPTEFLIYDRYESWRNMLHDSHGFERDLTDARYVIRRKWTDLDIAQSIWPERAELLRSQSLYADQADLADEDEWYLGQRLADLDRIDVERRRTSVDTANLLFNRRSRVQLFEMWYREPARVKLIVGGGLSGLIYDQDDDLHQWLVARDAAQLIDRTIMTMRVAVFVKGAFLHDGRSPYRHNRFPFTPIWGERRGRDGMPYGAIRSMRDPQEDFNKRMSKALHAMSTRRVVMDKGAVEDKEELREEVARPDAIIEKLPGKELELHTDLEISEEHLKYAQIDGVMIEHVSGVTDELLGRKTNAVSGKAIEARQDQGSTVTTDYFDNLRFAAQVHGQKLLSLCEQYITFPMKIRVIGERAGYDFTEINQPAPPGQDGQPMMLNDITRAQADFIVSAQDYRETMRAAAFEQLMDMTTKLGAADPQLALRLIDDVLEMSDIPGVEGVIKTIREMTGKKPRDYQPSPEEQAAANAEKQKQAQLQEAAQQLALMKAKGEVDEIAARANQLNAQAQKYMAEAQQVGTDSPVRQQYEQRLQQIRDDTAKLVDKLKSDVAQARLDAQMQVAAIKQQYDAQLEIADKNNDSKENVERIRQDAENERHKVEVESNEKVAKMQADADAKVEEFNDQIEELRQMLAEAVDTASKAHEAATGEKPVKKPAKAAKRVGSASRSAAAPAAPPPIVINMPNPADQGEEVKETTLDIQTDDQGRLKLGKIVTVKKRRPSKKSTPKE